MIRQHRAWCPSKPEPTDGFPIAAASAETAARDYVLTQFEIGDTCGPEKLPAITAIARQPQLILVREEDSFRTEPHRILVTAKIDIAFWGYPEEAEAAVAP